MRLVFFNRFFAPNESATSQLLSQLAFHLAARGHDVHVVTSHDPASARGVEAMRGVSVHRVARARGDAHGLAARASDYLGYAHAARRAARRLLQPGDVAVVETDPPMLSSVLARVVRERGAKAIVWLQDLFPEVAASYGIPGMGGMVGELLRRSRDRSLAAAHAVVAIGDDMAGRIAARACVPSERVHVIHNWADGRAIQPMAPGASRMRADWGLDGLFVAGYSGNFGRVHEFDTLLDAAALLRDEPGIAFLLVGSGPRWDEVRSRVERERLANVRMRAYREREALGESLAAADVHVVSLRPEFDGLVQPSKLYGILAAARPGIFIGSATEETARILREHDAGTCVAPGDAPGLARAILALRSDAALRARWGANARRAFESRYDAVHALAAWERLLASI